MALILLIFSCCQGGKKRKKKKTRNMLKIKTVSDVWQTAPLYSFKKWENSPLFEIRALFSFNQRNKAWGDIKKFHNVKSTQSFPRLGYVIESIDTRQRLMYLMSRTTWWHRVNSNSHSFDEGKKCAAHWKNIFFFIFSSLPPSLSHTTYRLHPGY